MFQKILLCPIVSHQLVKDVCKRPKVSEICLKFCKGGGSKMLTKLS